ncbi:MAG: hypothetical protein JWQ95_1929 [Sphaerisporangium sp.]|jgi:hypothetical protein|nr:hypothetical protein [Sphaerisporangium sp.]
MALQGMAVHGSSAAVLLGDTDADITVIKDHQGTLLRGRPGDICALIFAIPTPTVKLGRDTGTNFRSLLRMVYVLWRASGARPTRITVNDGPNTTFVADVEEPDDAPHDGSLPPDYADADPADIDTEAVVQSNMRLGVSRWPVAGADGANPPVLWGIAVRVDVTFDRAGEGPLEIMFTTAGADFTVPDE